MEFLYSIIIDENNPTPNIEYQYLEWHLQYMYDDPLFCPSTNCCIFNFAEVSNRGFFTNISFGRKCELGPISLFLCMIACSTVELITVTPSSIVELLILEPNQLYVRTNFSFSVNLDVWFNCCIIADLDVGIDVCTVWIIRVTPLRMCSSLIRFTHQFFCLRQGNTVINT